MTTSPPSLKTLTPLGEPPLLKYFGSVLCQPLEFQSYLFYVSLELEITIKNLSDGDMFDNCSKKHLHHSDFPLFFRTLLS